MAFTIVNAIVFQYSRLPHIFRVGRLVEDIFAEARLRHWGAVQFLGAHGGDDSSVMERGERGGFDGNDSRGTMM
jgi:hypothetical protein